MLGVPGFASHPCQHLGQTKAGLGGLKSGAGLMQLHSMARSSGNRELSCPDCQGFKPSGLGFSRATFVLQHTLTYNASVIFLQVEGAWALTPEQAVVCSSVWPPGGHGLLTLLKGLRKRNCISFYSLQAACIMVNIRL